MNNILKKFISVFLALIMIFQFAPISVYAANRNINATEEIQSNENIPLKQSLAEIIDETGTIIPNDLKEEISNNNLYKDLSTDYKNKLSEFLNVPKKNLDQLSKKISNSNDLTAVVLNAFNAGISDTTILDFSKNYTVDECLNLERKFEYLSEHVIDKEYIDNFAKKIVDEDVELNDLYGSMLLSIVTNSDYSWAYKKADIQTINLNNNDIEDKENYIYLQLQYNLSSEAIDNAINEEHKSPSQIRSEIETFQETTGLYALNGDLSTRDVSTQQIPQKFSKYQIPDASNYRDNLSIDQTYGMITYNKELITLKGKNGLDLQFGIRFDHNDAVVPGNYKSIEHSASAYQVEYITDWYIVDDKGEHLQKTNVSKFSEFYYDVSKHNEYLNKGSIIQKITDTYYYVFIVKDAKILSKDIAVFQESTYETTHNNSIYNLGEGWAFTLPSIELFTLDYSYGQTNVIHFADGQKYSFSYKNGKYELIGYDFKDIQLLNANSGEFSCDGKKAKWVLTYKDGRCEYFSEEGLYLGSTDQRGSKATATIRAYYDTSGYLIKITDSVGRSIKINHCVDEYEDEWVGVYKDYYTDIILCDSGNETGKTIYHFNKFEGGTSNGIPTLSIINVVDNGTTIKSTRFYYSTFNTSIFYNAGGGIMYYPDTAEKVFPYERLDDCMVNILTEVFDYSDNGKEGAHLQIEYEGGARYISNASIIVYGRVKRIKNTEQKFDENWNLIETPKNLEEYNYYLENKKTKARESLLYNGNWNSSLNQMWPQDLTNDYVLEISEEFKNNKAQKATEYHYGDDKYNDLISVYDCSGSSKKLYNISDIQRTNNNHNTIETVRLVNSDNGSYFCTLQKRDLDDYANTIYEWSAGGSSNKMNPVEAYYTINSQTTNYDNANKSIPSSTMQQTFSDDENMHYVFIKAENILDSANTHITKQNRYIYESSFDWNTLKDNETNTPIDSTDFSYDSQGRLIKTDQSVINENNTDHKITEFTYDSKYGSYIETVKDIDAYYSPNGEFVDSQKDYTYDILGRVLSCKDNTDDHITTYQYDTLGTVIKSVNPDGTEILTVPDYANKNVIETLADGSKAKYIYDSWDNLIEEYIWHQNKNKFVLSAKYEYDNNNRNTKKYEYTNDSATKYLCTSYTYDFLGRTIRETLKDETGAVLSDHSTEKKIVTYNNAPCEKEITTYYNSDGTENSHINEYNDVGGNTIRIEQEYLSGKYYADNYVYDNYNRLISSSGDTVETQNYIYDNSGRLIQTKNANNNSVYYTYNSQDQLIKQTNDDGAETKYYYTPHGTNYRTDTLVDSISGTNYYSKSILGYDVYGNIIQSKQNTNTPGETETFNISNYTYDTNNRIIMSEDVIDSSNSRYSQYCYDNGGNLIKAFTGLTDPLTIVDANNYTANNDNDYSVVSYEYDEFGNQTKYTDPLGKSEIYEYSFSNLLNKKTLRNGKTVNYTYDAMGRCIKETAGNETINYTYNAFGKLSSVKDALGTTSFNYDLLNRIVSETRNDVDNNRDYKSQYEYSGSGVTDYKLLTKSRNSTELQTSVHETYEYNNLKLLSKLTHSDIASPEEILSVSFTYGKSGEILNKQISGASVSQNIAYTYNKAGYNKQVSNTNTLAADITADYPDEISYTENYAYSLNGNLIEKTSVEKTIDNTEIISQKNKQTNYSYDTLNRLVQEQFNETTNGESNKSYTDIYSFDEYDNRISKTVEKDQNTITTEYQYDSANKLLSENSSNGKHFTYNYDNGGNLLSKSSINETGETNLIESYNYDNFNRLSSVEKDDKTYSYIYDGSGKRIQKNSPETQLQEFWNNGKIIFENEQLQSESNQEQTYHSYIFDNDLIAVASEGALTNLAITDVHGDTVKLVSAETPVNSEYHYDAFGIQLSESIPEIYNPYQYNGKYSDSETGFYYLNARYYNPEIGRFMQEDTYHGNIQSASSLNLYNYCASNPVTLEDGTGHFWETAFDVASLAWSAYDFVKKPNLVNGLFLAWDVVALVAPFVPGSYVAKGIKLVSKGTKYLSKMLKSSNKLAKTAKYLDKAYDTSKALKRIKNSRKALETASEVNKRKRQLAKVATENKVKELTKGLEKLTSSKGRKFTQEAAEQVEKKVLKSSPTLSQGAKNTHVYFGIKNGEKAYVGITSNVARREMQHGARFDKLVPITEAPLTRREARAIEQVLIEKNPQFSNKINSIAKSRDWYDEAIEWGNGWVKQNLS